MTGVTQLLPKRLLGSAFDGRSVQRVRLMLVALLVAGSLGGMPASAQVRNLTWGELALTHPVCYDVQGIGLTGWVQHWRHSPRAPYWEGKMGKVFWAMHHYCWALVHQQRANRVGASQQEREHLHRTAINDFYYVINNAKEVGQPDFVLMPELYYRAGDAYLQIDDLANAIVEFEKAKAAKADYWPPYVGHAQALERINKRKEAREVLERGLELMPGEPSLVAALARLSGEGAAAGRRAAASAAATR